MLDLTQFAFDLLRAGVCIEQPQWQFLAERSTRPLEPFSGFTAIAEYVDGESVDSADASKTI